MRRREFLLGLGGAAAWPLSMRAQPQERIRRVGVLMNLAEDDPEAKVRLAAFLTALQEFGWSEPRNLQVETRWTRGKAERIRKHAAEIVSFTPDVILAWGAPIVRSLQQLTSTLPIIFVQITDPVAAGLVNSLARPGGNITGFTQFEYDISGKWLELLKEAAPRLSRVAVLWDPTNAAGAGQLAVAKAVASSMAIDLNPLDVRQIDELDPILAGFPTNETSGLIVLGSALATAQRERITTLAARHRLPAIYPYDHFSKAGGLMSYGPDTVDQFRRAARYADRIMRGEAAGDLPVQAPTKFELFINLKTAKAIGLDVPPTLLARADEVIE